MKARVPQGPSMNAMLKQAQKMQEDMAALQAELETREYEISAGGGAVKIKISGKKEILVHRYRAGGCGSRGCGNAFGYSDGGINEAIRCVEETSQREMEKITSGMPGMPGLF